MKYYKIIGVMSGTSLDGIDIAYCEFRYHQKKWSYDLIYAETLVYPTKWIAFLKEAEIGTAARLAEANMIYGTYLGEKVKTFINKYKLKPDFIASHGHTLFHRPDKGYTFQLGSGAAIAAKSGFPVVSDFRSVDVALGGQGAPLVPVGDKMLFKEYDICLNLGGFANISFDQKGKRIAFDICPVNIVLNHYCKKINRKFDNKGGIARSGNILPGLLKELNQLKYYKLQKNKPRSLGKEWIITDFFPVVEKYSAAIPDVLRTLTEHAAFQISKALPYSKGKILVTGGGAYNKFLLESVSHYAEKVIELPDKKIIEFKEALIFAFLGVLRYRGEVNSLSSVTGASLDNVGGCIYSKG